MTIKQAAKLLEDKYMSMSGVYGVNTNNCNGCGGNYIEVKMNTQNKSLLMSIPSTFQGFRVEKVHQDAPIESPNDTNIVPTYYEYDYPYGYGFPAYGYPYYGGGRFPRPIHRPRVVIGGGGHHGGGMPRMGGGFRRR